MITVAEAKELILQHPGDFGTECIPLAQALGRILKEDIYADRDFPPFNRVAMDGIAINYRFFQYGVRDFKIEGIQAAGAAQQTLENAANCYEVMTGACLPANTDTVIRYEDLDIQTLMASVNLTEIKEGQNVHTQGSDTEKDSLLIAKETRITAAEIGVLATVGKAVVTVAKLPKVLIVSTGDELVNISEQPLPHQIRKSNVHSLAALLEAHRIPVTLIHLNDEKAQITASMKQYLQAYDAILCSGAVSKGKFDYLPEVFDELGVQKLFHRVSQRPGKPFWMGTYKQCRIFAFPGNPVSTYVNCMMYFTPWYYQTTGITVPEISAILTEEVHFKPALTYFLQVVTHVENGQLFATPVKGNGSGDLASLVQADGFICLPKKEGTTYAKGSVYTYVGYRTMY